MPVTILRGVLSVLLLTAPAAAQITPLWQTPFGGQYSVWSPTGNRVAMVGGGGIIVWDRNTDDTVTFSRVGVPDRVVFGLDGSLLYHSTQNGRAIVVHDATGAVESDTISFHDETMTEFGLCPDRSTGYVRYRDFTIVIWDVESRTEIMRLEDSRYGRVEFDRSGERFALLPLDDRYSNVPALVYSVETHQQIGTLGDNEVLASFPEDQDELVTTSQNGAITLWQISTGYRESSTFWSLEVQGEPVSLTSLGGGSILLTTQKQLSFSVFEHYAYIYWTSDWTQRRDVRTRIVSISEDNSVAATLDTTTIVGFRPP